MEARKEFENNIPKNPKTKAKCRERERMKEIAQQHHPLVRNCVWVRLQVCNYK